jgi:lipoprotein-releasing system permease protein
LNFPFYIAKRYVRSKSSQNAVNIINFITFLVIVIGSAALFIVLSGFAGLKTFSLSFTNVFDPDLKAQPQTGKFFSISEDQEKQLSEIDGVVSYAKEIEEKVFLQHQEKSDIAFIKGVDNNYTKTIAVDSTIYYGAWNIEDQEGVAGIGIANALSISVGYTRHPIKILALKPGKGSLSPQGMSSAYNTLPLVISGVYQVEESLDKKYIFVNLPLAQALLEKEATQISGINFKFETDADLIQAKKQIAAIFEDKVILKTREELNSSLYKMLNTENVATYLIFTLVLIIALFNVVGAIIMMILDKQQNSKTLYNLGVTIKELRRIYFVQGILVTTVGGIIGVLIGSLLIGSQLLFGWVKIGSIDYPVELQFINILIVLATITVLGIIASKIASSRINAKLVAH